MTREHAKMLRDAKLERSAMLSAMIAASVQRLRGLFGHKHAQHA